MKNWLITAIMALSVGPLLAQSATGCFELADGGNGTIEVRFNVTAAFANSNVGASNRVSRGEITLTWTGSGTITGFTNEQYNWFPDGSSANSVQYRFGPTNVPTIFTAGESILLLTLSYSGEVGELTINSSDLINVVNQDLATDDTCPTNFSFLALPVELSAFTAEAIKDSKVKVWCETASERNNDFFAVEHSTDGATFTEVGQVLGGGSRSSAQAYEFIHETPVSGLNIYRLRQVDYDGTTAYSELRSVRINTASSTGLSVFPNPAMEQINVSFSKNDSGTQIQLIDQ
ncbi:MAG: hypothetical protein AAGA62_17525, partial [Bacteroidota bacterium]